MSIKKIMLVMILFALVGSGIGYVIVDIASKKAEDKISHFKVIEIGDLEDDPAVWGKNFPHQYDSYLGTVDQVRTKYGGSEAIPRILDEADPRNYVAQSKLSEDSRLRIMWAGYPFSEDYRKKRGHAYMLID